MFNTIALAITSFFTMLTTLFSAGEKAAGAVDHLAGWGKESAATFEDEAKHDRELNLEEQAFRRVQRKKELAAKMIAADAEATQVIATASTKAAKATANT